MQSIDIAERIASKVRAGRARLGMTRKQLAAKADVSERYLHELENGAANATIGIIAKVADALELSPINLLTDADGLAPISGGMSLPQALADLLQSTSSAEQSALVPVISNWLTERQRANRGVALLGLRGAGKTTLGRMLAKCQGLPFVSVTREIEQRAGMGLSDLFNLGGPDGYRALENEVISSIVSRGQRVVLETAGGVVDNSEALEMTLAHFKTVWLKATPEEHLARVARQGDTRPMQGNPKAIEHLKVLLAAREPAYGRAEFVIDTTGRPEKACLREIEGMTVGARSSDRG